MQRHLVEYILTLLGASDNGLESNDIDGRSSGYSLDLAYDVKNFLDEIPGGFLIYKAEAPETIIYANRALIEMFGCNSIEEFRAHTGNSFMGVVHPDDLDEVEESIKQQIASSQKDLDYVEYRIVRKDGAIRRVEDYGHFIRNAVLGDIFYVFISDMTEKIESRLTENEQRESKMRALIEEYDNERNLNKQEQLQRMEVIEGLSISYESILYVDLEKDLVVPYRLNVRSSQNFNKARDPRRYSEFVPEFSRMWIHPEDRDAAEREMSVRNIRKKLAVGRTFYHNFRCVSGNDILHKQLRVVNVGEGITQIVIGLRNVDDELKQESQKKAVLEDALANAKRAAEAKNIFLSNMSHDMRTPLNAIFGFADLIKRNADNPDAVKAYADKISNAGGVILELTEKVLGLTYTESEGGGLADTECDIARIVHDVAAQQQLRASRKKITLTHDLSGVTDTEVIADKNKLKQILTQLADNAVKYTKAGGSVCISVTELSRRVNGYTKYEFKVADTGIGISKKLLPHVFDPFEREANSTSSGEFGPGLGLTIAKNYTELMGGVIAVESALGKGSTFTVTLDLRTKPAPTRENAQAILDEIKQKKILIVEDNEINLEIEQEILGELGFSTDSAENGKVAIDKIAASPDDYYAVVLMDIQMPVMDGLQAAAAIRALKNPCHARLPIIAVSANAFESDRRLSAKAGMDAHLPKPIDVNLLINTISDAVSARRAKQ